MPRHFSQAEVDPKSALGTLRALASFGFGDAEFELVHQWRAKGKLTRFKDYCEWLIDRKGLFRPSDNNHLLHLRLLRILERCNQHPPGRKSFESLAEEARATYPPIQKNAK